MEEIQVLPANLITVSSMSHKSRSVAPEGCRLDQTPLSVSLMCLEYTTTQRHRRMDIWRYQEVMFEMPAQWQSRRLTSKLAVTPCISIDRHARRRRRGRCKSADRRHRFCCEILRLTRGCVLDDFEGGCKGLLREVAASPGFTSVFLHVDCFRLFLHACRYILC